MQELLKICICIQKQTDIILFKRTYIQFQFQFLLLVCFYSLVHLGQDVLLPNVTHSLLCLFIDCAECERSNFRFEVFVNE